MRLVTFCFMAGLFLGARTIKALDQPQASQNSGFFKDSGNTGSSDNSTLAFFAWNSRVAASNGVKLGPIVTLESRKRVLTSNVRLGKLFGLYRIKRIHRMNRSQAAELVDSTVRGAIRFRATWPNSPMLAKG